MLRRKTAAYALLALYEIAQQHRGESEPSGVRAGDIAEKHKLPKAYVAKILSQLANAGILHSDRGPHGGFRLNHASEDISLYHVFNGVGAIIPLSARTIGVRSLPSVVQTALSRAQQEGAEALKSVYQRTTLADILKEK